MPLVSVITAAYNAEAYIAETIQGVLSQTFHDWEYIVVDDGSTDGTARVVQSFPEITYVYQHNQGVAAARNTALAYASGKYIALLDADDVWLSEKLALQVAAMQAYPGAGLCYTNASNIDEHGSITLARRIPPHPPTTYVYALTRAHHIVTSSVMFNRRYLGKQPYCIHLPPCEDFHVNLLVLYQGGPGIFVDRVLVYYRQRADSISRRDRLYWMSQQEMAVTRFLENAEAIRPLPSGVRSRAIGHLALQRAQLNIVTGGDVPASIALLLRALKMNPSDTWQVMRQVAKMLLTMNSRSSVICRKSRI